MDLFEAARLRAKWGNEPCTHPMLVKETCRGNNTGDKVCPTCGMSFSPKEVEQRRKDGG